MCRPPSSSDLCPTGPDRLLTLSKASFLVHIQNQSSFHLRGAPTWPGCSRCLHLAQWLGTVGKVFWAGQAEAEGPHDCSDAHSRRPHEVSWESGPVIKWQAGELWDFLVEPEGVAATCRQGKRDWFVMSVSLIQVAHWSHDALADSGSRQLVQDVPTAWSDIMWLLLLVDALDLVCQACPLSSPIGPRWLHISCDEGSWCNPAVWTAVPWHSAELDRQSCIRHKNNSVKWWKLYNAHILLNFYYMWLDLLHFNYVSHDVSHIYSIRSSLYQHIPYMVMF